MASKIGILEHILTLQLYCRVFHNILVNPKICFKIPIPKKCFGFFYFGIGIPKYSFWNVCQNTHYELQVYYEIPILKKKIRGHRKGVAWGARASEGPRKVFGIYGWDIWRKGMLRLIKNNLLNTIKMGGAGSWWWSVEYKCPICDLWNDLDGVWFSSS